MNNSRVERVERVEEGDVCGRVERVETCRK